MKRLYMDESGECSFSSRSVFKHFLVTVISVDDRDNNKLKSGLRKRFSRFIRDGWDKTKEPKAYEVFRDKRFGPDAVVRVLETLTAIPSLEISYLVVNKERISNQSFRNAAYGIPYNYFTGVLLSGLVFQDELRHVSLVYDQRNKETHEKKHFREYLETKIIGTALENNVDVDFSVTAQESRGCYGLLAVDYYSWAIFRRFEYGDDRFFNLFQRRLKRRREWYT